jgi:hypothetical protein
MGPRGASPAYVTTGRSAGTTPFLGPDAFLPGPYIAKSVKTQDGGQATFRGYIVFTNLGRDLVGEIVPQGLELAENHVSRDVHPVMYLFGFQENTRWIVGGETLMEGESYDELMLLVPFVRGCGGRLWHTHAVRMYLNHTVAINIGNRCFAYAKERGKFDLKDIDQAAFRMTAYDDHKQKKFRAKISLTGRWRPSAEAASADPAQRIPNYATIQTILAMPIVGRRRSTGELVCSYFDMDYANTRVAPIESVHEFVHPFVPEMSSSWTNLGRLSNVVDGAVAVERLEWHIDEHPLDACRFRDDERAGSQGAIGD